MKWPMSVLRLRAADPAQLVKLADRNLCSWRGYSDASCGILASTTQPDGTVTPHNTITPIARMRDGAYELDLVLRNNRTTEQFPLGIYHPHPEYHHIKKENIGLIEVMGLAVLPARLKNEMEGMREFLRDGPLHPCTASAGGTQGVDRSAAGKVPGTAPGGLGRSNFAAGDWFWYTPPSWSSAASLA